jgi:uncharacterized membrane protein/thiol-disulfide isomerase/thioredoxin
MFKVKLENYMSRIMLILLSLTLLTGTATPAYALENPVPSNQVVVRAVLFFSPSCGHCHTVIEQVLPPIKEKYGEQLEILLINITTPEGRQLFQSAAEYFKDLREIRGVPTLVVGEQVLIGSLEIPEQFPNIVEASIQNGGMDWPSIPGLQEALPPSPNVEDEAGEELPALPLETKNIENLISDPQVSLASANEPPLILSEENSTENPLFIRRFLQDPIGNSIAVVTLIGMLVSTIAVGYYFVHTPDDNLRNLPRAISWPGWAIPVLCLAGLGVAGYMSYVEITQVEAICGPVGDCNTVQQSPYATLWGFLPVGILGIIGYIGIGASWFLSHFGPASARNYFTLAMWGMALLGTLFSIYLTFLEPFVIGATCAWCITSAVLITMLLWASTGPAVKTMTQNEIDEY